MCLSKNKHMILTYLKFISVLLLDIIKSNPAKTVFLTLAIISYQYIGSFEDTKTTYDISTEIKMGNDYLYIYEEVKNDEIVYGMKQFDEVQKLEDNKLIQYDYSGFNVTFWVIFVISGLVVTISTIAGWFGEEESGWELDDSYKEAVSSIIYCVEEDGIFYYMSLGRLLSKRDNILSRRYACSEIGIKSLRDIYFCPKFQTKSSKRENFLNKIGIK